MNKKKFLLPLLAVTLGLTGCSELSEDEAIARLGELTQNISDPTGGPYDFEVRVTGFVGDAWSSDTSGDDSSSYYSGDFRMDYSVHDGIGVSALLGMPGIITHSNYEAVYEEYQKTLIDSRNYTHYVQVRANDIGGFDLYVENSNVKLSIYGVGGWANNGGKLDPYKYMDVTARFNITYSFDENGFLTTEHIEVSQTHTSDVNARVDLTAVYPEF